MTAEIKLYPLDGLPLFKIGDDVGNIIGDYCLRNNLPVTNNSVIIVASKILSKTNQNCLINLRDIVPSKEAKKYAEMTGRDSRFCELVIRESQEILEVVGRMIICRHRLGFICTNGAVDSSNVSNNKEVVSVLPHDPDEEAKRIGEEIKKITGKLVGVVITDTFGTEDRISSYEVSIGVYGIPALTSSQGQDLFGKAIKIIRSPADSVATVAGLLMSQGNKKVPVVMANGITFTFDKNTKFVHLLNYKPGGLR